MLPRRPRARHVEEVALRTDASHPGTPAGTPRLVVSNAGPTDAPGTAGTTDPLHPEAGAAASSNVVPLLHPSISSEHREAVRERLNTAVRPVLKNVAGRRGLPIAHLLAHIDGARPLTAPPVVNELGIAFVSHELRVAIAAYADRALIPFEIRTGVATMVAHSLGGPPPAAIRSAFPDWSKPLVPYGHVSEAWQPADAARWLEGFPPRGTLPHPLGTWDDRTAAIWLDDQPAIAIDLASDHDSLNVVTLQPGPAWKPAASVLACLDDLDLETLSDRVFRERFRREVMLPLLSNRRAQIRSAIDAMSYGYLTLEDARRAVRAWDVGVCERFDRLFGSHAEWIFDLVRTIVDGHPWPPNFTTGELAERFESHQDGI